MQTNFLWSGVEYQSMENCLVNTLDHGASVSSTIVGTYQGMVYLVDYHIEVNENWETVLFEIHSRHSNQKIHLLFESDGAGTWMTNGQVLHEFDGCIDIDIPITPFTNTLPINRLKLRNNDVQEIQVLYLDLLQQEVKTVRQRYARISDAVYRYENVPNDFEAEITVDESGFVVDYPSLFTRSAAVKSYYPQSEKTYL
jgi:uncharacterized protein